MAMTLPWLGWAEREERKPRRRFPEPPVAVDPALRLLLERRDDRLLRDAGLTREGVLGEEGSWWAERAWRRDPWWL